MERKTTKTDTHRGLDVGILSVASEDEFVALWRVTFRVYERILSTMAYNNIQYCLVHLH